LCDGAPFEGRFIICVAAAPAIMAASDGNEVKRPKPPAGPRRASMRLTASNPRPKSSFRIEILQANEWRKRTRGQVGSAFRFSRAHEKGAPGTRDFWISQMERA
jgi:hypothetical protein